MTPDRWNDQAIDGLKDKIEDIENESQALKKLPERMADMRVAIQELRGDFALILTSQRTLGEAVASVKEDCQKISKGVGVDREPRSTLKVALTFAAVVIIPIILAFIGGYFTLRAAGLNAGGKK